MPTTTQAKEKIMIAASSDIGMVRKQNEDAYYYSQNGRYFVLCDGMGGHQKGALAARFGCETLRDVMLGKETVRSIVIGNQMLELDRACEGLTAKLPAPAMKLLAGIRLANRRIYRFAELNNSMLGTGTTIVAVLFHEGHIYIAHVGDSRLYRLRGGELTQMTTDHSWLNELLEDNEISESEVKNFQKKNVLTRALGISNSIKIDLQIAPVHADDLYIMCSDGLSNALPNELIHSILTAYHGSLQNKVSNLVSRAKMMDGSDNITAGVIHTTGQWNISKPVTEKITVNEPSVQVTEYLDQLAKTIYPITLPGAKMPAKKMSIASLAAAAVIALATFLFYAFRNDDGGEMPARPQPLLANQISTAPARQVSVAADRKAAQHIQNAGQLVLLQIDDPRYVQMLSNIGGIRILDTVSRFSDRVPVHAGSFTWAVADAHEKILYKKRNLQIVSLDEWSLHPDAGIRDGSAGISASEGLGQDSARVYLIGDFNKPSYRDASIIINGRTFGVLSRYKETGFYLESGNYSVRIVDAQQNVLNEKSNINIRSGEAIAIEF